MAAKSSALTKEDLKGLMKPTLDAERAQIEDISIRYLTKPGDNYGSLMLAVDVRLAPGPRTLPIVAKMLPKSAALQDYFQCESTVRKEIYLYTRVRPAYEQIQRENNVPEDKFIDVFPVCYGARISSKGDSGPVDETSVILQENLRTQGFECGDRTIGLNLAHCKLVVDKLARFHATAVAMKIKKPELFKETVIPASLPLTWNDTDLHRTQPLINIPEYETMKERIEAAVKKSCALFGTPETPREPFATITHLDLWTNNIMFQYEPRSSKDHPTSLKFVDFQITGYGSPARDLLFFLYSSAQLQVLSEHYDYLVRLYYDNFVDCLKVLGCDTSPFSFENFMKEMKYASAIEFYHIAFMLPPISLAPEDAVSIADMTQDDFSRLASFGKSYIDRARKFVLDFSSRNWI
ncbi:uncharacterized protein LOC134536152 isoform X1 [Bacillus rossius redtenbacheri]|uniref:uncharacterized protein LOC134536152 isoform X1 n=1 Tax=Bacillus rossius redtenbacheri TaxID=93214 RepID=UPI002FDDE955